jgi:endonuclease/exonuclease/phosphatase family metal-dependent hydrolase
VLVLLGRVRLEGHGVRVTVLDQRLAAGVDEVDVVSVALLGLVAGRLVVGAQRRLAVANEAGVLLLEEVELALGEVDEPPTHAPRLAPALRLLVRTWNLYHGRSLPPSGRLYLERMVRLVTADAPDVVALQEVPLWALGRLERWSGMAVHWAVAVPALLRAPLARAITQLDSARFRSLFTGQANALLLNPRFEVGEQRLLLLNPGVSRWEWLFKRGFQQRFCQALTVRARGHELVVANLHATNNSRLAEGEAGRAADFVADAERCVLCGDFNVRRFAVPTFSEPIDGIDQILVRGLELERGAEAWPTERRRVGGALLSDHAPVEAVVAWT